MVRGVRFVVCGVGGLFGTGGSREPPVLENRAPVKAESSFLKLLWCGQVWRGEVK